MELNDLRTKIDALDKDILRLLEQRLDLSAAVADYKKKALLPVKDPAREAQKLNAVRMQCRPETADMISDVFRAVLSSSCEYQRRCMEAQDGK